MHGSRHSKQGPVLAQGAALSAAEGFCPLRTQRTWNFRQAVGHSSSKKVCCWVVAGFPWRSHQGRELLSSFQWCELGGALLYNKKKNTKKRQAAYGKRLTASGASSVGWTDREVYGQTSGETRQVLRVWQYLHRFRLQKCCGTRAFARSI